MPFSPLFRYCALLSALLLSQISADTFVVQWYIPDEQMELPAINDIPAGTTLQFQWILGYHDVVLKQSHSCARSNSDLVLGDAAGVEYTIPEEFVGKDLIFSCNVGDHCEQGQILRVSVSPSASPTGSGTTPLVPSMIGTVLLLVPLIMMN